MDCSSLHVTYLTLTLPFPVVKFLKNIRKNLISKNYLKTKTVVKWLYVAIIIKKKSPMQLLPEKNTFLRDNSKIFKA